MPANCAVPPPPDDLDDIEREWWAKLGTAVDESGTYAARDEYQFRNLVTCYAMLERWRRGREALRQLQVRRRKARAEAKLAGRRSVGDEEDLDAEAAELDLEQQPLTPLERLSCARTISLLLGRFHCDPRSRGARPVVVEAAPERPAGVLRPLPRIVPQPPQR
jgi:hypothetical protein